MPTWPEVMPETIGIFFSADGTKLQAVNNLGDVRIWDTRTSALLNTSINYYTRQRLSNGLCYTDSAYGDDFVVGCFINYMDPPCIEETPGCYPVPRLRYEIGIWDIDQIQRKYNLIIDDSALLPISKNKTENGKLRKWDPPWVLLEINW